MRLLFDLASKLELRVFVCRFGPGVSLILSDNREAFE